MADKPGTFRVRLRPDGSHFLSGVRANGERVKVKGLSWEEAQRISSELFSAPRQGPTGTVSVGPQSNVSTASDAVDDWGLPVGVSVSPETIQNVAQAIGANVPRMSNGVGTAPKPAPPTEEEEKKARRAKQAKSLMELAGIGWASGSVWAGRKWCKSADLDPVLPNSRQVNDLADVTKETLQEMFGDRELKPWQLCLLLTIGIPVSMFIQSPKSKESKTRLQSIP